MGLGRVLIVAGSDSGGGAGIQGDIKTVTALRGYATTAVTALTAQNTQGVFGVIEVPPAFVSEQMRVVLSDIGTDCIKTGMLGNAAIINAVAEVLEGAENLPLVVDPVMVAKGGASLLDPQASETLKARLLPKAMVLTPNLPEAQCLVGFQVKSREDMARAAHTLLSMGPKWVLLKGGHLEGPEVGDLLVGQDHDDEIFIAPRIETTSTHGTGCTLASAIATGIAQGLGVRDAVVRGRAYLRRAIEMAPGLGHGHGPLGHAHTVRPFGSPSF